jgi:aquaporin Z
MAATSRRAPAGFAPIAIGLTLTAIHIMAIPVSMPRSPRAQLGQRRVRRRRSVEPTVGVPGGAAARRLASGQHRPLVAGGGCPTFPAAGAGGRASKRHITAKRRFASRGRIERDR